MFKKIIIFFFAYLVLLFFLFAVSPSSAQILTASPTNQGGVNLGAPIGGTTTPTSFADYTNRIYQFAVVIGISLAVLMIIFAGYKYMSSAGDPQSLAEAKEVLVGAIVGLVLILLTRLILASIDPRLLQFPNRAPELGTTTTTSSSNVDTKAKEFCQAKKKETSQAEWQKGSCLTKDVEGSGYAIAIPSDPKRKVDNYTANSCGVSEKFYEFDWDCNLIRKVDVPSF